jgi:hypothetical protein
MGPKRCKAARPNAGQASRRSIDRPHFTGFWKTLWDKLVPLGYEDATGFHHDVPPALRADKKW